MVSSSGMKTISSKIKINFLCYFIFLSFLLTGFIKNILLIFLIICIHEAGHIFFLRLFHYEIVSVELFPFGGMTKTEKLINSPINKDILIYLGGILFQILLGFVFLFSYKQGYIMENTLNIFHYYNKSILLFNLLPIRPLDGGEILLLFFQKYLPYGKTLAITNYTSIFFLILFILYNIKSNLNQLVVISFLLFKIIEYYKKREYFKNKFLLERYLYSIPYKKIEHHEKQNMCVLKKETLHFFRKREKYIHERELLREKFDIHSYF